MATQIKAWQIVAGQLEPIETSLADEGRTEHYDLEEWIASNPAILGSNLTVIGRQVMTRSGPLDLLALDHSGNLVIVELKRDMLPREALVQAIDYASDIATWGVDRIGEVCAKHTGKSLEDQVSEVFPEIDLESLNINETQRILLVGFSIGSALERMIGWLSESYGVGINAIILHYIRTAAGDELLAQTAIISEEVEQERTKRKKFTIEMSDEPGNYEREELEPLLADYLSQDMKSARMIRDVLLPVCLEAQVLSREELKEEIVKHGEEEAKAGYVVSVISGQIGMAKNDFLRQVIAYDYPNDPWEKDNYCLRTEYRVLVGEVLELLNKDAFRDEATGLAEVSAAPPSAPRDEGRTRPTAGVQN